MLSGLDIIWRPDQPIGEPDEADRAGDEDAVVASQRREAREDPGHGEGAAVALQAAGRHPQGGGDERLEDREVFGLGKEGVSSTIDLTGRAGQYIDLSLNAGTSATWTIDHAYGELTS